MPRLALPPLLVWLLLIVPGTANAAITFDPAASKVTTSRLELDFGNAPGNVERLDVLRWRDSNGTLGSDLAVSSGPACTGTDPADAWGHAGSLQGQPQPVGSGNTGSWTPRGRRSIEINTTRPTSCTGTAVPPVRTRYTFFDTGGAANKLRAERRFAFSSSSPSYPNAVGMRAYVPHMAAAYSEVLHPNSAGTALVTETPGDVATFETNWNQKWLAINHPTTDAGVLILRETTPQARLALLNDGTSNSSAVDLLKPAGGWLAPLTETEWLCFYDSVSWPVANRSPTNLPSQCTVVTVPINVSPPVISGTLRVGSQVSTTTGTWDRAKTPLAFQWFRCNPACTAIPGATGSTYMLTDADEGAQMRADVTATATTGSETDTASSALTNGVQRGPPQAGVVGGPPTISGEAREGETLTGGDGSWTGSPTSFLRQWMRCRTASGGECSPIPGATSSTYKLTRDDVGNTIRFRVQAVNSLGTSPPVDSLPTGIVQQIVLKARLRLSPNPTCTGIRTYWDASGSTTPNGPITSYRFTWKEMPPGLLFLLAFGATFESIAENLPTAGSFTTGDPSPSLTHTWNRLAEPRDSSYGKPGVDYMRDFLFVTVTVTDLAGATSSDTQFLQFAQVSSSQSRQNCPSGIGGRSFFLFGKFREAILGRSSILADVPCKRTDPCAGNMEVQLPRTGRTLGRRRFRARSAQRKRRKPTVLARNRFFTIPAGRKRRIEAKLTKAGRRYVRRNRGRRRIPVTIRLTSVTPAGKKVTRSFRVKLRRAGQKKRTRRRR